MARQIPKFGVPQAPVKPDDPKAKAAKERGKEVTEALKKSAEETKADQKAKEAEQAKKSDANPKQAQEAEQKAQKQTLRQPQTSQDKARQQESQSRFDGKPQTSKQSQLPSQLGHKINTSADLAKTLQNKGEAEIEQFFKQNFKHLPPKLQKQLMQPRSELYKTVVNERFFRQGNFKNTPLHQKLTQRALQQQAQAKIMDPRKADPLDKGELLQFARLRHQAEDKKRFRDVLRHELARAKLKSRQKVGQIRYQNESRGQKENIQKQKADYNKWDIAKNKLQNRLSDKQNVSQFEKILQKALAGQKSVPSLAQGVRAKFLTKTESAWKQFFTNVKNLGSHEVKTQSQLSKMIEVLFRGIFQKEGQGLTLIADFSVAQDGEVLEHKFSQLLLNNPKLAQALQKLSPGDVIPQQLLQMMGEDALTYLQLAHLVEIAKLSEAQQKEFIKSLKQSHSKEGQRKIEAALMSYRDKNQKNEKGKHPFEYAGHLMDEKLRHPGPTKFFMYVFYSLVTVLVLFGLFLLFRNLV